ncbi:MAG: MarR family winged helix-turn-helix transcriptional regulator [Gammaproteobacteria bacterium]
MHIDPPIASASTTEQYTTSPAKRPEFYTADRFVIEESIGYILRTALNSLGVMMDAYMAPHGLTATQWRPLLMIAHGKARTAAELAALSGTDTGAVTRMIDRLEAKGLLSRRRCVDDRRVVFLDLTEQGRQAAAMIPCGIAEVLNHHLRDFSAAEVEQLKALLRRLIVNGKAE